MIDKKEIVRLVEEKLDEKMFIVDITVNGGNTINIFIDSFEGITIEKCIEISRHVEHNLDREKEDFELQVSSPGLNESFKVLQQYFKYRGKEIEVVTDKNEHYKGVLKNLNEDKILLETSEYKKVEGQKKKQLIKEEFEINYKNIKSAKAVVSFK